MSVRAGAVGGARAPRALVEAQAAPVAHDAFGSPAHRPLHEVLTAGLAAADLPAPAPTEGWEDWKQSASDMRHRVTHGWKKEYKLHVIKAGKVTDGVVAYMKFPAPPKGFVEFMGKLEFAALEGIAKGDQVEAGDMPHAQWIQMVYANALEQAQPFNAKHTCMDIMCAPASLAKDKVFLKYLKERPRHADWKVMHRPEEAKDFGWHNFGYFLTTFVHAQHGMNVACYLVANVDGREAQP